MQSLSRSEAEAVVASIDAHRGFGAAAEGDDSVDKFMAAQSSVAASLGGLDLTKLRPVIANVVLWVKQLLPIFVKDPATLAIVFGVLDVISKWFPVTPAP